MLVPTYFDLKKLNINNLEEGKGSNINRNPIIIQCTLLNMNRGVKNNIVKIEETFDTNTDIDDILRGNSIITRTIINKQSIVVF